MAEPTIIGQGNSGIVFFPSLKCVDDGFDTTGYVSKLVSEEDAQKEMRNSAIIQTLLPDCAVYYEHMCKSVTIMGDKDTLLFSKYRGKSLNVYIADYLEWLYYTGKPSKYYKGKKIPLHFFKDMLVALKKLYVKIKRLNENGYFHNDIQQENIIYDEIEKKAYVIDFERLSTQPLHPHLTDAINMKDLIDTLNKYINGIEFSLEDKRFGGTKKYKKFKRKNRLTQVK